VNTLSAIIGILLSVLIIPLSIVFLILAWAVILPPAFLHAGLRVGSFVALVFRRKRKWTDWPRKDADQ